MKEYWKIIELYFLGSLGASFAAYFNRERFKTKMDIAVFIVFGGITSNLGAKLLIHYYVLEPTHIGTIGFLIGAFGGFLCQKAWNFIHNTSYEKIWDFILLKFGGPKK